MTTPLTNHAEATCLIEVMCGEDTLTIPFWADYWGGDLEERVLRIARELAQAYAYAADYPVTIRTIMHHRSVTF